MAWEHDVRVSEYVSSSQTRESSIIERKRPLREINSTSLNRCNVISRRLPDLELIRIKLPSLMKNRCGTTIFCIIHVESAVSQPHQSHRASKQASQASYRAATEFEANVSDSHQALECRHRVVQVIGDLHHSLESIAQMAIVGVFGPRVLDDVLEQQLLLCGERERESERLTSGTTTAHSLTHVHSEGFVGLA